VCDIIGHGYDHATGAQLRVCTNIFPIIPLNSPGPKTPLIRCLFLKISRWLDRDQWSLRPVVLTDSLLQGSGLVKKS
jgi:hypothetical protein